MYYFYVLISEKDEKYYYGPTANLKRRFHEHIKGEVEPTKYRLPVKLVYYEAYEDLAKARVRERQVKSSGNIRKQLQDRLKVIPSRNGPARPPAGKPGQ